METREFDPRWEGRRCQVGELSAKAGRHVSARLICLLGEALQEGGGLNVDMLQLTGAALRRAKPEVLDWLTEQFIPITKVEKEAGTEDWIGAAAVQELMFGGSEGLARWGRWLAHCVEVSCGDFFGELLAEAQSRQATVKAKFRSPSQTNSRTPGSSTESPRAGATVIP